MGFDKANYFYYNSLCLQRDACTRVVAVYLILRKRKHAVNGSINASFSLYAYFPINRSAKTLISKRKKIFVWRAQKKTTKKPNKNRSSPGSGWHGIKCSQDSSISGEITRVRSPTSGGGGGERENCETEIVKLLVFCSTHTIHVHVYTI